MTPNQAKRQISIPPNIVQDLKRAYGETSDLSDIILYSFSFILSHYNALDELVVLGITDYSVGQRGELCSITVSQRVVAVDYDRSISEFIDDNHGVEATFGSIVSKMADFQQMALVGDVSSPNIGMLVQLDIDNNKSVDPVVSSIDNLLQARSVAVWVEECGNSVNLSVFFNRLCYRSTYIKKLTGSFLRFLGLLVDQKNVPLKAIEVTDPEESAKIVYEWNRKAESYNNNITLLSLVEHRVAENPKAIAIEDHGRTITYEELDRKACKLASIIAGHITVREEKVGVFLERSIDMVVAVLAIFKAGGCYVPLDIDHVSSRLESMVDDSGLNVVISREELRSAFPHYVGKRIFINNLDCELTREEFVQQDPRPLEAAYLIYTSGSTGTPKGVVVTHYTVANYILSHNKYTSLRPNDRQLQVASCSFDVSILEIFSPLVAGATCVISGNIADMTLRDISDVIINGDITTLFLPPTLWVTWLQFLKENDEKVPKTLKRFYIGADKIEPFMLRLWYDRVDHNIDLFNGYGPTEATICSTIYKFDGVEDLEKYQRVPIGKPIGGAKIYILDKSLKPAPIYAYGEIYIGGEVLARGYHNQPSLTEEKFIPDPFLELPGQRMYRTGDIGRYLPDGNIEFLGRCDSQVKIRGYRVEIGEIESVILNMPEVSQAVVVMHERNNGNKYLAAYLVFNQVSSPSERSGVNQTELRKKLRDKLPYYMIPELIVECDTLPLLPSGKVDRGSLVPPGSFTDAMYSEPEDLYERQLADIWAEVLECQLPHSISRTSNFFNLGGQSLLAMKLVSRIKDRYGVKLSVRSVFDSPLLKDLAQMIRESDYASLQEYPITAIEREKRLKTSYAQRRVIFIHNYEGELDYSYNIPWVLRIEGALDIGVLNRTFNRIIERQESLRTKFEIVDGEPFAVVDGGCSISIPVVEVLESDIEKYIYKNAAYVFDLSRSPLLNLTLLRLHDTCHILLLNMHHTIADGWSVAILIREFSTIYETYLRGEDDKYRDLSLQYVDYAYWQRLSIEKGLISEQIEYWVARLKGAPTLLDMPKDFPRSERREYRGNSESTTISESFLQNIKEFSADNGVSLFMTLLAVFKILLHRYTGESDLLVGSVIANRNNVELEEVIGFFANTVVLRTEVCPADDSLTVLNRIKASTLEAYEYPDVPFEYLVSKLNPERRTSHSPLFQVFFALQDAPFQNIVLDDLKLCSIETPSVTSKFDLSMYCWECEGGLRVMLEYDAALFRSDTICRILGHYTVLLKAVISEPRREIGALPILTDEEYNRIVFKWNETSISKPKIQSIHNLIEQTALSNSGATALVSGSVRLTYGELNDRANRLAHYLIKAGLKPGERVGIFLERSERMVIAMLSVLKAGGCYVPLDPNYPKRRTAFILADTEIKFVLTEQIFSVFFQEVVAHIICIDEHWGDISIQESGDLGRLVQPDDLAYILFTSGSTGTPKGVSITHGSVVSLIDWARTVYSLEDLRGTLASTSICFDLSVFEIFVPLVVGGTVILSENALVLSELPAVDEVTLVNTVPSIMTALVNSSGVPNSVRVVNLCGEVLQQSLVDQLYSIGNIERVYDLYGPSEDTTYSTCALRQKGGSATIGRPIAGTQIYILNEKGFPVPVGVIGELYIGGAGLAKGYYNRPELTADKFIKHSFSDGKTRRLYRTGDLARFRSDGNIEYMGRIDHQVKVRGFRIELGEIEQALLALAEIKEAAASVFSSEKGEKYLVAYVVAESPSGHDGRSVFNADHIKQQLKNQLPDYMVPPYVIQMESLPLTANGKLDRKSLPPPEVYTGSSQGYVEPRTILEKKLVSIWEEVLGFNESGRVGIHDNFFKIGGDSLLVMQLISKANQNGMKINIRDFFEAPTVERLAQMVDKHLREDDNNNDVVGYLPLTVSQSWYFSENFSHPSQKNISALFATTETLSPVILKQAIDRILQHHDALRTLFMWTDSGWSASVAESLAEPVFAVLQVKNLTKEDRSDYISSSCEYIQSSLDISRGPLLKFVFFDTGNSRTDRLLITIHHLIADGMSFKIVVEDLMSAYRQIYLNQEVVLGNKTSSIRDVAEAMRKLAHASEIEADLNYWISQKWDDAVYVPTDYPRLEGSNTAATNRMVSKILNADSTAILVRDLSEELNIRFVDILLAALTKVVTDWTHRDTFQAIYVDSARLFLSRMANLDLSRTAGWISFSVPMFIKRPCEDTTYGFLRSISEQIESIPNGGRSYELLYYTNEDKNIKQQLPDPIDDHKIVFNYLGSLDSYSDSPDPLLRYVDEYNGPVENDKHDRCLALMCVASIVNGELNIHWHYSADWHKRETIDRIGEHFVEFLERIVQRR